MKELARILRESVPASFSPFRPELPVMTSAFVFGIVSARNELSGPEWAAPAALLALGAILAARVWRIRMRIRIPYRTFASSVVAWGLLFLGVLAVIGPGAWGPDARVSVSLFSLALSAIAFFASWRSALWCALPLAVFLVVVPAQSGILLLLSSPLRLISTMLSGEVLRLFGVGATYSLTTIRLSGEQSIAITDACSGIQQLEALLLLGCILVNMQQRTLPRKLLQYCFILPSVILANAIRIVLTALLFQFWGDSVFRDAPHVALGFLQVILAVLFFYGAGALLAALFDGDERKKGGEA